MPVGAPSKYKPEYCELIQMLEGACTDSQIADLLRVNLTTVWTWRQKHLEFDHAVKMLKSKADNEIESALFLNAKNLNPTAQIFWLKNRKRADWKDRTVLEGDSESPLQVVVKSVLDGDK